MPYTIGWYTFASRNVTFRWTGRHVFARWDVTFLLQDDKLLLQDAIYLLDRMLRLLLQDDMSMLCYVSIRQDDTFLVQDAMYLLGRMISFLPDKFLCFVGRDDMFS